jgi:hypothetical protein
MKKLSEKLEETTLREFMAHFCADIDIFLLKDESQENDNDKLYTKEEIRKQLHNSLHKFINNLKIEKAFYDIPLLPSLSDSFLRNAGFSEREIRRAEKEAKENN